VPAVLILQRNRRGLFSFVLMGGLLTLSVLMIFGWAVWPVYFVAGRKESAQVLNAMFSPMSYMNGGVSVFWMLRSYHAGLAVSYAVQAVSTLAVLALSCRIWQQENMPRIDRMALTVFLSLLATPYGYTDDMVAWSIALVALAERRGWRIDLLDVLFWLWPMLCPVVVMKTGILFTPFVVVLAVARTWARAGLPVPHLPMRAAVLPRA
jgi:alpha-1,2-mannosyltransferase